MSDETKTSRRDLFLGVGALAAVAAGWRLFVNRSKPLEFEPIPGLDGWRQTHSGDLTSIGGNASSAVLAGIGDENITPLSKNGLCPALYQNRKGGVPVAVFSDFYCPNCRTLDARLAARTDLAITWHQLPLLGPSSEIVARALMAADLQDGYVALRDQLLATPFRPMLHSILEAAINAGLDAETLGHQMHQSTVQTRLAETRSAAETLGIFGTPSFTIGRTLAIGAMDSDQIDELVNAERETAC